MTTTTNNPDVAGWPKDRRAELAQLQQLLQEAASLNNSTGTLDRLTRIDSLAAQLIKSNLDTGRVSFLAFLVEAANTSTPSLPSP